MALLNRYDGFIFDYGKVLVHDQTGADREEMAAVLHLDRARFEELYWLNRLAYDKATLTGIDYWQEIARAAGQVVSFESINQLVALDNQSWMHYDDVMWDFVNELHAAHKQVAVLSNMPLDLGQALRLTTQRLAVFDHVTLSCEVKSVKPEPEIYEHCLQGIGTPLKRTIFFDDKIANVRGAEMLGLDAIEFLNRDEVLTRLRS